MKPFRLVIILIFVIFAFNLVNAQRLDPTRTYYWYYDNSLPKYGIRDANYNELSVSAQQEEVRTTIIAVLNTLCSQSGRSPVFHFEEAADEQSADLKITFAIKTELAGCSALTCVPNTITFSNEPFPQGAPAGRYYWLNTISHWDPRGARGSYQYYPYFQCLLLHEVGAHVFAIGHSPSGSESDITRMDPTAVCPSATAVPPYESEKTRLVNKYNPKFDITIRNYFSGSMNIEANGLLTIDKSTFVPYDTLINFGGKVPLREIELNILLSAKRQQADGHWQKLNYYQGSVGRQTAQIWELYEVESGNLSIYYKRECNLTYRLYYNNAVQSGTMTFNGTTENVTVTKSVDQESTIQVNVPMVTVNDINYYFRKWDEDNNTENPRTFTASQTTTYTAKLLGYAYTPNVHFDGAAGDPITVDWDDHPNTAVTQYKVWRKDPNNLNGVLLATVNRGTTSYTDYDYTVYDNSGDYDKLYYAVTAYFSTDDTWSTYNWRPILGEEGLMKENLAAHTNIMLPKEYKLDNYPNPFNPTTTINYQLPEAGMVTLRVYDILGQEVATLVNEMKQAGYYSATFDAGKLTSGIYISTIQTNNFSQSKKMLLVK